VLSVRCLSAVAPKAKRCKWSDSLLLGAIALYRFFANGPIWATAALHERLERARVDLLPLRGCRSPFRVFASKLELKRRDGSGMLAPRGERELHDLRCKSPPVQTIPLWRPDRDSRPFAFDGLPPFFVPRSSRGRLPRISAPQCGPGSPPRHPPRSRNPLVEWAGKAGFSPVACSLLFFGFCPRFILQLVVMSNAKAQRTAMAFYGPFAWGALLGPQPFASGPRLNKAGKRGRGKQSARPNNTGRRSNLNFLYEACCRSILGVGRIKRTRVCFSPRL